MNLVIDIGNTRIKIAWFSPQGPVEIFVAGSTDKKVIQDGLSAYTADKAIISAVGRLHSDIIQYLKDNEVRFLMLDSKMPVPLKIKYRSPETLGYDRIAAAVGAHTFYPDTNVMVVDMGTAITIDLISNKGEFLGGNISPGMAARFRSLHEFTAKLPLVSINNDFPLTGSDTESAIAAGVQLGMLYELKGYIRDFKVKFPEGNIIITGGDADFFVNKLKKSIFVVPNLVLIGLNNILDYNAL